MQCERLEGTSVQPCATTCNEVQSATFRRDPFQNRAVEMLNCFQLDGKKSPIGAEAARFQLVDSLADVTRPREFSKMCA